jgi:hypothetical protein
VPGFGSPWPGLNKDNGDDGPGDGFWVRIERGIYDTSGDEDVWVQRADVAEYGWKDVGDNPYDEDYVVVSSLLPGSVPVSFDVTALATTLKPGRGRPARRGALFRLSSELFSDLRVLHYEDTIADADFGRRETPVVRLLAMKRKE